MNKLIAICLSTLLIGGTLHAMNAGRNELGEQLIKAARTGDLALAKEVIAEGVKVNYIAHEKPAEVGDTALIIAAEGNHPAMCELLIAHGANVNFRRIAVDHSSPLMIAVKRANQKICRLLVKNGADVNQLDGYGNTALMVAIRRINTEICKLLIDATLEAPINPARLSRINLTPEQKKEVVLLLGNLKATKAPGHEYLQRDTKVLIAQTLANTYKLRNMIRAQIIELTEGLNPKRETLRKELLEYLDQK